MQLSHLLGAGVVFAALGLYASTDVGSGHSTAGAMLEPPLAAGHYALVVQGDRDQLSITHAVAKADPWSGVPKGFTSAWSLSIRDANGKELASVPLDLSKFDLSPQAKGQARTSQGCIVIDSHVAMLANVPAFAEAASYTFLRERTEVGTIDAAAVRQMAGGGR
jgi:hypothetical protein